MHCKSDVETCGSSVFLRGIRVTDQSGGSEVRRHQPVALSKLFTLLLLISRPLLAMEGFEIGNPSVHHDVQLTYSTESS